MQIENVRMILKNINDHPQRLQVKQSEEKAFAEVASPEANRVLLSLGVATSPESEVEAPTGFFDVFKRRMA
ncbi:hypothetical protein Golob_025583 [Gossypium lobatum]|uniref:Uncharacterized protein n=1 Tax=Gossypium lobatum TaxID=34289 RepID=A0A7J8LSQ8_9ROSI|nr:hypothetical protein [Gossypium lobatum]